MNGLTLKLIAMLTMLIDHATELLVRNGSILYLIGRSIGRLAFPIFCFLLVEGLLHTKNVKKYLIRLGIFALISEIPFDLAFGKGKTFADIFNLRSQNVFFTLFIGLLVIFLIQIIQNKYNDNKVMAVILISIIVLIGCQMANYLRTDYSYMGVLMIVCFYLFKNNKLPLFLSIFLLNLSMGPLQVLATISFLFIFLYNGERGPKINKYVFYAFYPVHILVLYWISTII